MDRNELTFTLALVTIAIALAFGLWQFFSVRRSQKRRGEAPGPEGGTEQMLHHRERADGPVDPLAVRPGAARTPRAPD
ncbi:MAG: hypothetical protein MUF07_00335 [Steroidobacteraceae bacterium]|jgi:hypothetical protein|nr:hypothetical protein [Steroidobacteraceae bacterium]